MIERKDYGTVARQLETLLKESFDKAAAVRIADDVHYKGTNLVVTSAAFAGLLPEQRFARLLRAIPQAFYDRHLRRGLVWFELAPGESGQAYMKMPRSEDITAEEPKIVEGLRRHGAFEALRAALNGKAKVSSEDLGATKGVLKRLGMDEAEIERACLVFIRHGGLSDAMMLAEALPKLGADGQSGPARGAAPGRAES